MEKEEGGRKEELKGRILSVFLELRLPLFSSSPFCPVTFPSPFQANVIADFFLHFLFASKIV